MTAKRSGLASQGSEEPSLEVHDEPPRGFPQREYEARLERAQVLMKQDGFDALLLMREPEVRYFSGFVTQLWQSPTRPWFLVVPASGKPIAVIPEIGAQLMRRTWIDDVRTWPSPRPEDDGVSLLADTLRAAGAGSGRIGLLKGPETTLGMPLADYVELERALPPSHLVDATALIRKLRLVKSEAEIAKIGHTCALASAAFETVPALAFAGRSLARACRDFKLELLRAGADGVPYLAADAGPGGYEDVIAPPREKRLQVGDILMMDTGSVHDGYFCDFDRNYAVGRADDAALRAYQVLQRAVDAGLRAAVPGATCAELFHAMRVALEDEGYHVDDTGRMGHGLGLQLTEWPSIHPGDLTVLSPGMVLTLEPSVTLSAGRRLVHEEDVVVREDGAQWLSRRAPPDLPCVEAPH